MKAMARQRTHSIEFKLVQEFIAGESLYALSKRHDISRQLIRVWVQTAPWPKTPRLPNYSRNTKPRLRRWSAWLAAKRSKSSS
jgi:transposase-like protein